MAPRVSLSSLGVSMGPMAPSSSTWSLAPGDVRDIADQTGRSVQNLPQAVSELADVDHGETWDGFGTAHRRILGNPRR